MLGRQYLRAAGDRRHHGCRESWPDGSNGARSWWVKQKRSCCKSRVLGVAWYSGMRSLMVGRGIGCGEVREEWKAGDGMGRGSPYLLPPLFLPIPQGLYLYRSISPSFPPFLSSLLLPVSLLHIILMEGGKDSDYDGGREGGTGLHRKAISGSEGERSGRK